jgi:ABC-2 type transport system permease protein
MPLTENWKVNAKRNWFVLVSLVTKDFKLKYRRSILGIAWSVLNPLLMMVVISAVFAFIFSADIPNFPLYLILGQTVFTLMGDSTSSAMGSIISSASLIKKIRIEKIIFPLEKVVFNLVNFAISLIAVVIVMVYFRVAPSANLFFLPLLLVYLVLFCGGLGLALSALSVFFRDVMHLWSVVIVAWTYATPLFYPIERLPGIMQALMQFNPMYHYVTYFRDITMWDITPSLEMNLMCLGMGLVTFALGFLVFRKTEKRFILYV